MTETRTFVATTAAMGLVALAHAAFTWPARATVAFFVGGALVAFVAEAIVIHRGWLEHHAGSTVLDVPLYVLLGWTGTVYLAFRLALLVTSGWPAVGLAALVATAFDVLSDPQGVADGHWTYTDDLPGPRHRGVPWWNYVGWLLIGAVTAGLATPFL